MRGVTNKAKLNEYRDFIVSIEGDFTRREAEGHTKLSTSSSHYVIKDLQNEGKIHHVGYVIPWNINSQRIYNTVKREIVVQPKPKRKQKGPVPRKPSPLDLFIYGLYMAYTIKTITHNDKKKLLPAPLYAIQRHDGSLVNSIRSEDKKAVEGYLERLQAMFKDTR